jgi:glycosyltransferase involved in cell wall biosynthesis
MHVALIGTHPPERCGIATFTADVAAALRQNGARVTVIPVLGDEHRSPSPVAITRDGRRSYVEAARLINCLDVDLVLIQHEFGIFGGEAGEHVLALAGHLDVPFAVTMHTVLPTYSDAEASVLEALGSGAVLMTVMTESARRLVVQQELAPAESVVVIPHGAPAELFEACDSPEARERFGIEPGAPVMTTFG